jgi:hypothetical protein
MDWIIGAVGVVVIALWYASAAFFVRTGYLKGYTQGRMDERKKQSANYKPPSDRYTKRRTYRR